MCSARFYGSPKLFGLPPLQNPWSYTRPQRIGLLVLFATLALVYGLTTLWRDTHPPDYGNDHALFTAAAELRSQGTDARPVRKSSVPQGFSFDPNSVGEADLQRLGLSAKQARAFTRYRAKVSLSGSSDIARIRVLRPAQVEHLQEWARFSEPEQSVRLDPAPVVRFPFDPNTLSLDSLQLLGLTEREARALEKYRSYRPQTFRRPEDLARVRALNPVKVGELVPWVSIRVDSQSAAPAPRRPDTLSRPAPYAIDINRAQASDWQQLPGIGPTRAQRILRYRELLGGFVSADQVGETYGLPDSTFQGIAPLLRESPIPRPLYVNRSTAEELAAHPYLPRTQAVILVRYRDNHGPFASLDELKKVRAISTETLDKLLPYLNFDP